MLYPTELLRHLLVLFNFHCSKESNNLPLRRRVLYPAELLRRVMRNSFISLLKKFRIVKKNRHIFRLGWNILSNSLLRKEHRNMLTLVMEPGDLDDMIFDEYDGGPSER